jgi:hypothetical protein
MLRQAMATKSATKRQVVSVAVLAFFTGTDDAVRRRATDDIAELAGLVRRMHALASPPPPCLSHSCAWCGRAAAERWRRQGPPDR